MKAPINTLLFSFLLIVFLSSSCRTYLSPALPGNNMGYLPRQMEADSIKSLTHASASYAGASSPGNGSVSFEMGMLNINRAHTFKGFNVAYGVMGYLGNAEHLYSNNRNDANGDYPPAFNKKMYGFGLRTSVGFHSTSINGNTDFRFINWENALSTENGAYADFRDEIYNGKVYNYAGVSNRKRFWTTGLSTEVIFRARRNHDIKHAFRLFIGGTPGLANSFKYGQLADLDKVINSSSAWNFNYFLSVKRFTLSLEIAKNINLASKISLGYKFQ
ncbi:hypothetical protein SAMN04488511_10148 [Pedobacter suwonensis]|uniref:Uncharacterized protein n=2 Tax=Pedobacter suwonensis TaxID=332999 RepID=A0A1I0SED9_9SPHI|nr:hypothetical protein SAMN04488511_10148 [Pedobacter suwonensis]